MRIVLISLAIILAGCKQDPAIQAQRSMAAQQMEVASPQPQSAPEQRVSVKLLGKFADDIAYGQERGIYLVRDAASGQEWIGISGVGIAEVGRHSSGKTSRSDER